MKISNPGFLIFSEIVAVIFQSTFCENSTWRRIKSCLGKFFVCKIIDLSSSFKFHSPGQIWNSAFITLSKKLGHPLSFEMLLAQCAQGGKKLIFEFLILNLQRLFFSCISLIVQIAKARRQNIHAFRRYSTSKLRVSQNLIE